MMSRFVISMILFILLSCGYGGGERSDFARIDSLTNVSPREALALLDNINPDSLSDSERHRYDLLTIKARDKAYIRHTSDSLILDVIDYYSSYRRSGHLPEALYYGGRIYSDLGDFPSALHYFQDALGIIPDDVEHRGFKGIVYSQTGRLLNNLRMYSDAVPYMRKAIEISREVKDSFKLAYDYGVLYSIYLHKRELDSARIVNQEAIKWAYSLPESDQADMRVNYALILHEQGKTDSALQIIRPLPALVDSICRHTTLSVASMIYFKAGITDTAYMYAHELALNRNSPNRKTGFKILLSPGIIEMLPSDSLRFFISEYKQAIENLLDTYDAGSAIYQNSAYNYNIHLQRRIKAERAKNKILEYLIVVSLLAIVLIVFLCYRKLKNYKWTIRLYQIRYLADFRHFSRIFRIPSDEILLQNDDRDAESVRQDLVSKLRQAAHGDNKGCQACDIILNSDVYQKLLKYMNRGQSIFGNHKLWSEIDSIVESTSPLGFKKTLMVLTRNKLTQSDLQIALLMKCGFSPSQMTVLLSRSMSAISTRRLNLSRKILSSDSKTKDLDDIIQSI